MDTKQLVDKFVSGEITEEQFEAEKAKLSPEDQEQLKKDAEEKLPDAVEKLKGVRRGIDTITQQNVDKDVGVATKLKEENLVSAKDQFFAEMGIVTDEDKKAFEEGFKSESVTVDNIKKDMEKHYGSLNSSTFITLLKEKNQREQDAEEMNAQNGGANGSGNGGEEFKKASKEVQQYITAQAARGKTVTIEQAERALEIARNGGHL